MRRRKFGGIWQVAFLLLVAFSLWWIWSPGEDAEQILANADTGVLGEALLALPAEPADAPSYSRDEFGPAWADVDRNGCDTRNDMLARDLTLVEYRSGTGNCIVETGRLEDPYTGQVIEFVRGEKTSPMVQIDHVVALADAWKSGAYQWSVSKREEFANDPLNLLAVDGPANQEKGSYAADEWLPSETDFHCEFVARQIAVKSKWDLAVTEPERTALATVLAGCTP